VATVVASLAAVGVVVYMSLPVSLASHATNGTLIGAMRGQVLRQYGRPVYIYTQTGPPSVDVLEYPAGMIRVIHVTIDNTTDKVISVTVVQ
jgi:hypothetical protein